MDALELMDEWMANIRANPKRSVAENRPAARGRQLLRRRWQADARWGCDVWDGILDGKPKGKCTQAFPLYSTSRIVAGAPIEGGIYKCALKPVRHRGRRRHLRQLGSKRGRAQAR